MGLNLSNAQIAKELGLNPADAQRMTEQLREGLTARASEPVLSGTVECDEVYIVAGHKGNQAAVSKKNVEETPSAEGSPRARHVEKGKTASVRDGAARWGGNHSDVGKCSAVHYKASHSTVHQARKPSSY